MSYLDYINWIEELNKTQLWYIISILRQTIFRNIKSWQSIVKDMGSEMFEIVTPLTTLSFSMYFMLTHNKGRGEKIYNI